MIEVSGLDRTQEMADKATSFHVLSRTEAKLLAFIENHRLIDGLRSVEVLNRI